MALSIPFTIWKQMPKWLHCFNWRPIPQCHMQQPHTTANAAASTTAAVAAVVAPGPMVLPITTPATMPRWQAKRFISGPCLMPTITLLGSWLLGFVCIGDWIMGGSDCGGGLNFRTDRYNLSTCQFLSQSLLLALLFFCCLVFYADTMNWKRQI